MRVELDELLTDEDAFDDPGALKLVCARSQAEIHWSGRITSRIARNTRICAHDGDTVAGDKLVRRFVRVSRGGPKCID